MNTTTTSVDIKPRRKRSTGAYVAIALVFFAVTVALLYLEENWRGKRAWAAYKAELQAKGRSIEWRKRVPEEVPADKNIFKAPGMEAFIKGNGPTPLSEQIGRVGSRARAMQLTNVLIARVTVLAPSAPGSPPSNSLEEAAMGIQKRAQALAGASGIMLFKGPASSDLPLELTLAGEIHAVQKHLEKRLQNFAVHPVDGNRLEIVVGGVPAETYVKLFEGEKAAFDQLRSALKLPLARMDGSYDDPLYVPIQDFVRFRMLVQTLGETAQSYILVHKPEEAFQALTLIHESQRMITAEPARKSITLVGSMINVAITGLYLGVLGDGQRLGVWRESDFAAFEAQLASMDLVPLAADSLNAELISTIHMGETISFPKIFDAKGAEKWKLALLPKGWVYQNLARYADLMEEQISAVESNLPRIKPRELEKAVAHLLKEIESSSPYMYLVKMAIPNTGRVLQTTTKNQTLAELARISCALERFRSAQGRYPEKLDELSPKFLQKIPLDLITGQPPIYKPAENGNYRLYAVAWNEKDDGGTDETIDWVWNGTSAR